MIRTSIGYRVRDIALAVKNIIGDVRTTLSAGSNVLTKNAKNFTDLRVV